MARSGVSISKCRTPSARRARKSTPSGRDVTAFQISVLAQFAREALSATQPLERDLDRLEATMKDLSQRLENSANEGALKICESLDKAVAGAKGGENVAEQIGQIQELAVSLYGAVNPGRSPDDLKSELNKAITLIKSRGRRD